MGSVASNSYSEALDSPWCAPPKGVANEMSGRCICFGVLCVFPPFLSREKLIWSTDNNNRHRKPLTGTIERSDGNRPSHHIVHNNKQPTNLSNQFQSVSYLFRLDFAIVSTHTSQTIAQAIYIYRSSFDVTCFSISTIRFTKSWEPCSPTWGEPGSVRRSITIVSGYNK